MIWINIWFILTLGYYGYENKKYIIAKVKFDLRKHSPSAIFFR